MQTKNPTIQALARFALVVAAAVAATALWAQSRPEQGLLLDAQSWQAEVIAPTDSRPWPVDGWYRLLKQDDGVDVSAVTPTQRQAIPAEAMYFRLPGITLKTGLRSSQRDLEQWGKAGPGRFSIRVEEVDAGVQYAIGYDGQTYNYVLGPRGAQTSVDAVADLDGDGKPDFLVDVVDQGTYLLLSSRAQPGFNLPTAELPAHGC
jgi:hypothetical protein